MTGRTRALVLAALASAQPDSMIGPLLRGLETQYDTTVEASLRLATAMDIDPQDRDEVQRSAARNLGQMFETAANVGVELAGEWRLSQDRRRTIELIAAHLRDAAERLRVEYTPET